jgi:hypothetical protein
MSCPDRICIAFAGARRLAEGDLRRVATALHQAGAPDGAVLVFDAVTSEPVEIDLRGSLDEVLARLPAPAAAAEPARRGPGRPKLGVVAREITLLPRHWDWLARQPGGASVAIRKLIDDARRTHAGRDGWRQAQEAAYRFATAAAGNLPGFEEAMRSLFAGERDRFATQIADWPDDIRDHLARLAATAFAAAPAR